MPSSVLQAVQAARLLQGAGAHGRFWDYYPLTRFSAAGLAGRFLARSWLKVSRTGRRQPPLNVEA